MRASCGGGGGVLFYEGVTYRGRAVRHLRTWRLFVEYMFAIRASRDGV